MTILMMRRAACTMVTVALAGAACPAALAAQAGPPVAKVSRDTLPAVKQLRSPSPPPSAVAPRRPAGRVVEAAALADSGPRAVGRVAPPPDSVRPAAQKAVEADPARAPRSAPPPPAVGRAAPAQPAATNRAMLQAGTEDPPVGATARCKDGTWVTGDVGAGTCLSNGGLAVRLPQKTAPRPPNP